MLALSLQWGAVPTFTCAVGVGLFTLYDRPHAPPSKPPTAFAPAESASVHPIAAPAETELPLRPEPTAPGAAPAASSGTGSTSPPSARSSRSSVQEEIRRIDDARSALERGDPQRAILYLDEYGRAFPTGAFWQEAAVLRIDAYVASGDHRAATRAAAAFVRAHPDSPYAVRLHTLAREVDTEIP